MTRLQSIAAIVLLTALAAPLTCQADGRIVIVKSIHPDPRLAIKRNRDLSTAEANDLMVNLNRKSADYVLRVVGHPHSFQILGLHHTRWCYEFGPGSFVIQFQHGRVSSCHHNERQTGISEDDFVGVIGIGGP
jgi:hypothetical protein